jgi:hypothetical protein
MYTALQHLTEWQRTAAALSTVIDSRNAKLITSDDTDTTERQPSLMPAVNTPSRR